MSFEQQRAELAKEREQLFATVSAIREKLDVPKQTKKLVGAAKESDKANPRIWLVGIATVGVAVVAIIAAAASKKR